MVRLYLTLVAVLCLAAPVRADEPHVDELDDGGVSGVSVDEMFETYVAQGDIDRAAGRKVMAAMKYQKALRLKRDPLISGRFGVLLAQIGRIEEAVEHLLEGLRRARVSKAERMEWETVYANVLAEGSWVRVKVSHKGATLILDKKRQVGSSTEFFLFLRPGDHAIHATLEGFEDADVPFTTTQGDDAVVEVVLSEVKPELEPPSVLKRRKNAVAQVLPHYTAAEDPYGYPDEPVLSTQTEKKTGVRWSLGGGPAIVFGVASWSPAVGLVVSARVIPHENISLGLEGRAAWLANGAAERQINAMTAGALASVCGHWRWLFGCALGHLGVISVDYSSESYKKGSDTFTKPGLGARVGAKFSVTNSFGLQASTDALALSRGTKIYFGQKPVIDQPAVMMGAQIAASWEF